ncbi:MAG TPA: hypothetical protein VGL58_21130 [Caulobacteraceae bacterium]|jgi:hypothetical protein
MSAKAGHETSDLPAGWAALAIAGLLSLIVVGALVAWGMTAWTQHARPMQAPSGFQQAASQPASPRLEVDALSDRLALERRAEARLAGYGWADRAASLAHIPIGRAMSLLATQGWPDADTGPTNAIAAATPPAPANATASERAP